MIATLKRKLTKHCAVHDLWPGTIAKTLAVAGVPRSKVDTYGTGKCFVKQRRRLVTPYSMA